MERKYQHLIPRFSIQGLCAFVAIAAFVMSLTSKEPLGVALAATYCFASSIGMTVLYLWSRGMRLQANFSVKSVIFTLLLFSIVIGNFVLENGVHLARYLVLFGWIIGIPLGFLLVRLHQRQKNSLFNHQEY